MIHQNLVGFRLSPQQKYIWSAYATTTPGSVWCDLRLTGRLDQDRLQRACLSIANRHEIFRTRFQSAPGIEMPYQIVEESLPVSYRPVKGDGSNTSGPAALKLETGPVLSFALTTRSPELHTLRITAAALCADGITLRNLAAEIAAAYSPQVPGNTDLASRRIEYADVSEWFNRVLAAENETRRLAEAYCRKLDLASIPALTLPLEDRRAQAAEAEPAAYEFQLDDAVACGIRLAAAELGVSSSDFLLACWSSVLWRITGQPDIPLIRIGDGRSRPEFGAGFGVFARPLPALTHFSDAAPFPDVLRQVGEASAESSRFQDCLPPEEVLGPPERRQLGIGFEFLEWEPKAAGDVAFSLASLSVPLYPFKLKLTCVQTESGLNARLEYHPNLFDASEAARIAGFFQRFVQQAAASPQAPAAGFEILAQDERRHILEGFNPAAADYPLDLCFHRMFEQQVERVPERTALVFGREKLTYAELNLRANRLAHYLRTQGVAPGARVGLFVERSAGMIVALLGILKAGGAYVALHPALPKARLAQQLADSAPIVVITQQTLVGDLPALDCHVYCIDRDGAVLESQPDSNPEPAARPTDPIYVIFTSGSTGVPKAVVTRHENVVNYTQSICRILKLDYPAHAAGLSFANVSTLSADLGNTPIFAALASGGSLHMIPDEVLMDAALYGEYVKAEPIDVLKLAPSHLRNLLSTGDPKLILPRYYVVVGGERLTWEMVEQIKQSGQCKILNHYSPTETTIGALTFDVSGNENYAAYATVVPLGRGIGNTLLYVLDRNLKPVPVGVPGELLIGGAGVSNGYLNRPDLTAERFVTDPVDPASGRLFYRSGDRARWLPGGVVEFLGREDDQVKIRGFRVELGEIEAVLARHPAVRQAVVVLNETAPAGQMLMAFLLAPEPPAESEIRSFLRQHLPDYMVPAQIVAVETFPLNANGKADRRALAASVRRPTPRQADPPTPAGAVETALLAIWREVLGRADIGVTDDFFDLGGHSLLATLVVSRARAAFPVEIPLRSIFEAPTVAGMAKQIEQAMHDTPEDEALARLLMEVEALSDEDARKLLEE